MPADRTTRPDELEAACRAWIDRGRPARLLRWLGRELGGEGYPRTLLTADWPTCLAALADARARRPDGWPAEADAPIEGLLRATLRFRMADDSLALAPDQTVLPEVLRFWGERLEGVEAVSRTAGTSRSHALAETGPSPERPLAILRSGRPGRGDSLAIDHRDSRRPCRLELAALGRIWLGPTWEAESVVGPTRTTRWQVGPEAELLEWTFRTATARVTRTALLLRRWNAALLGEQVEGAAPEATFRVGLGGGVDARVAVDGRTWKLRASGGRTALAIPLGLPPLPCPEDLGSLNVEGEGLVLRQRGPERRRWLPLLLAWGPRPDRRPLTWQPLTVTDRGKVCAPEVAVAYRLAWSWDESLIVYRSLARPALRAAIGHQIKAAFLIGRFGRDGKLDPILEVDP